MNSIDFRNDIPQGLAQAAHAGTSWVPEQRATQEREGYASLMQRDLEMLRRHATTPEKEKTLEEEFARYRAAYAEKNRRYLSSRSRVVSSAIAGPSNFPARRMEKRGDVMQKRLSEMLDFRKRVLDSIVRTLHPEWRPIMSGDANAQDRLKEKIAAAEAGHERMKKMNRAYAAFLKDPAGLATSGLPEGDQNYLRHWTPPVSYERLPFPGYALQNSSANIRRMKERLTSIGTAQATPETTTQGTSARLEDCPPENRVRLFFPGKPAEQIRTELKRNGFRWTPSLECWQAYRNPNSIAAAKRLAGGVD
jgi:hypothetical protein